MDGHMLGAAIDALVLITEPERLLLLGAGVLMGLTIGIIPGIGGVTGMAMILPFTFTMDPYSAFALLLGLLAVVGTSDTIPAVLFGVPGTSAAQATVMDGNPMAKKGEAGRALSAAYTSSLLGGLFGAVLLGVAAAAIGPLLLYIRSPEALAFTIFGISMVAVLSGSAPLRGITAAGLGIMLALIGVDNWTGTLRWSFGTFYLWDGLPLVPALLGLFAVPELADLAIKRMSISKEANLGTAVGMKKGVFDALRNWWLIIRCCSIGALVGALPGLGASVVDWLAYSHALRTEKGAKDTFGKGDVRGVIAPESANNTNLAGSLIPTLALGVPGGAATAILLGAMTIQGLVPGPDMLTTRLDVTYSMIWSIAIANILGAGICFMFSGQLAKMAMLRYTLIVPFVLSIVFIGAFQASVDWGDFYALLFFSVLGWFMKMLRWARPPLILGLVLGELLEKYMFISVTRYGAAWLLFPIVMLLLFLSLLAIMRPLIENVRSQGGLRNTVFRVGKPTFRITDLFYVFFIGLVGAMMWEAYNWRFEARLAPTIVGWTTLGAATLSLVYQVLRRGGSGTEASSELYMDSETILAEVPPRQAFFRAGIFLAWIVGFLISVALIGMIPTLFAFVLAYMRVEGNERWSLALIAASLFAFANYLLFYVFLTLIWPSSLIGKLFPVLKAIPSV